MVKLAVMTSMYDNWINNYGGSHERLLRELGKAGVGGIEAFCNLFMDNDELLKLYQKEMTDSGLVMPVMDLISNLAYREKSQRQEAYEKMRKGIDICAAMGTEIVHVAGCALVGGVSAKDGRKLIAEGLMEFVDDVEKRGMILAFENYDLSPNLICSVTDCLEIIKLTGDRVKFVFDTGNFESVGEHAESNFASLIGHTCHFHFKDLKKDENSCEYTNAFFGEGVVKNRQIAKMIKTSGYNGWVALETFSQVEDGPAKAIPRPLALLKSWF